MIAFPEDPVSGWNQIKRQVDMRDRLVRSLVLTAEKNGLQIIYNPVGKVYMVKLAFNTIVTTDSVGGVLRTLETYFLSKGIQP